MENLKRRNQSQTMFDLKLGERLFPRRLQQLVTQHEGRLTSTTKIILSVSGLEIGHSHGHQRVIELTVINTLFRRSG